MGFKKLRSVNLPEKKQGLVRYICLTEQDQPKWVKEKIQRLCQQCGGEYAEALHEVMCSEKSMVEISRKYYVSESVLYQRRKAFYERWFKKKSGGGSP